MSDLHDLTALEQGAAVRRGEVSPLELVDHYLGRTDDVGAFVTRTPELAREQAAALGNRPDDAGPLFGVPTAIKDLNLTAGIRTTFGSPVFADFVPEVSDAVTLAMEAAGHGQPRQDLDTLSSGRPATPSPRGCRQPSPRGTGPGWQAAPPVARPPPWPPGWCPSPRAPTAVARSGSPRRAADSSGLKPTRGRISGAPMYGDPVGLGTAGADLPDRPRRGGDARRARRSSGGGSVLGATSFRDIPGGV